MRLIDANALYNDLKESAKAAKEWKKEAQGEEIKIRAEQTFGTFVECALRVKEAPTIEAEPVRRGRWRNIPGMNNTVFCSECLAAANKELALKYKGCPFCLARMDGGAEK